MLIQAENVVVTLFFPSRVEWTIWYVWLILYIFAFVHRYTINRSFTIGKGVQNEKWVALKKILGTGGGPQKIVEIEGVASKNIFW